MDGNKTIKSADFMWFWLKTVPLPCRMLILALVRNGRCSVTMRVVVVTCIFGLPQIPKMLCQLRRVQMHNEVHLSQSWEKGDKFLLHSKVLEDFLTDGHPAGPVASDDLDKATRGTFFDHDQRDALSLSSFRYLSVARPTWQVQFSDNQSPIHNLSPSGCGQP